MGVPLARVSCLTQVIDIETAGSGTGPRVSPRSRLNGLGRLQPRKAAAGG